jgi:hypothetical protein
MTYKDFNRAVSDNGSATEQGQYSLFSFRRGVRKTAASEIASKDSVKQSSNVLFVCELQTEVRTGFYSISGSTPSRQYAFHPPLQLPNPTQSINLSLSFLQLVYVKLQCSEAAQKREPA